MAGSREAEQGKAKQAGQQLAPMCLASAAPRFLRKEPHPNSPVVQQGSVMHLLCRVRHACRHRGAQRLPAHRQARRSVGKEQMSGMLAAAHTARHACRRLAANKACLHSGGRRKKSLRQAVSSACRGRAAESACAQQSLCKCACPASCPSPDRPVQDHKGQPCGPHQLHHRLVLAPVVGKRLQHIGRVLHGSHSGAEQGQGMGRRTASWRGKSAWRGALLRSLPHPGERPRAPVPPTCMREPYSPSTHR